MIANRIDANQPEIVSGLRECFTVQPLTDQKRGVPDLLVGGEMPCPICHNWFRQNKLVEIKTGKGKLNELQAKWHSQWRGQIGVARTIEEALRICGRI